MKARIKVRSFHWVIVERIEAPETSYLLEEGDSFHLVGLGNQKQGFKVIRISPTSVDILLTGPALVSVTQDTSIGQGPHCPAIFLNVGDNKTVATPSCDAGIVWTITLEGVD